MAQCLAKTKDEKPCQIPAVKGRKYCHVHLRQKIWRGIFSLAAIGAVLLGILGFIANITGILGYFDMKPVLATSPIFTPFESSMTLFPIETYTSTTPTEMPTVTFTPLPSNTSTPTIEPVLLIKKDCFDSNNWTPYEYVGSSVFIDNGCWNLNYWGFTARDSGMIITPPISPKGIGHGIYTPIKNTLSIKLSITVKEFNVHPVNSANIAIGVVDNTMPGLSHSRVIYYHYIPEISADHIAIKTGEDAEYKDLLTSTLVIGETQDIYMQLDGPFLTIFINGEVIELTVPFEQRVFWISYSVPDNGELVALISNLEIK